MRRIKPKTDWCPFYRADPAWRLDRDTAAYLKSLAAFRSPGLMVRAAELCLSAYPSMVAAMDNAPRPAHQIPRLKRLLAEVQSGSRQGLRRLRWDPNGWDQGLAWDLHLAGYRFDSDPDEASLVVFCTAARKVLARLQRLESRHGPTRYALAFLIHKLGEVFDRYYDGPARLRDIVSDNVERPTKRNVLQTEFVSTCLKAVGAPAYAFNPYRAHASRSRLVRKVVALRPRGVGEYVGESPMPVPASPPVRRRAPR